MPNHRNGKDWKKFRAIHGPVAKAIVENLKDSGPDPRK